MCSEFTSPAQTVRTEAIAVTSVAFLNPSGAVADPSSITLVLTDPTGTITNYTYASGSGLGQITKISTGDYSLTVDGISVPGLYTYSVDRLRQQRPAGHPRYLPARPAEQRRLRHAVLVHGPGGAGKSRLGLSPGDKNYNLFNYEMQLAIHTVANWVNKYCGRTLLSAPGGPQLLPAEPDLGAADR